MAAAEEIHAGAWSHRNKNLEKQKTNYRMEKGENLQLEEAEAARGTVRGSPLRHY